MIKASAGSGKTYRLTLEYIRNLVINPLNYRNILAVTFTNKATAEMKERILKELSVLARLDEKSCQGNSFYKELLSDERVDSSTIVSQSARALSYILHDYSRFSISTIDKFFQKIVRSFVREMGLDGGYNIKFDNDYILELAIDRVIDEARDDMELWSYLQSIIIDSIEENKSLNIKKALLALSRKIHDEHFDASSFEEEGAMLRYFEALSEASKAAKEELVRKASQVLSVIKSYNLEGSDMPGKSRGFYVDVEKISRGEKCEYGKSSSKVSEGDVKWSKSVSPSAQDAIVAALRELIDDIDSSKRLINTCDVVLKEHKFFLLLGRISRQVAEIGRESNSLLMSSTMKILSQLTSENDAPFIYEKMGSAYHTYMIDEFQDTSTGQWRNFAPLLNDALSSTELEQSSVTLLGDIKQSIYGWRGGNWRLLDGELVKDIVNRELIKPSDSLTTNWRSKSNVIEFNNKIIARFVAGVNTTLNDCLDAALEGGAITETFHKENSGIIDRAYQDLYQDVRPGAESNQGYIEADIVDFKSGDNLTAMMRHIEDAQDRGYKPCDIALLIHTGKEAALVADYILEYKEQHPEKCERYLYDFVSAEALKLSSNDDVIFVINMLRASCKREGGYSVEGVLCNSYLGEGHHRELSQREEEFVESIRYCSLLDSFEKIISFYQLDSKSSSVAYIQALHQAVITFCSDNTPDTRHFIEWWDSEGVKSVIYMPESPDSMLIVTIHKSKGLEFPVVILPFCYWALPPRSDIFWASSDVEPFDKLGNQLISYSKKLGDSYYVNSYYEYMILSYIERTNMLYVALTRSRDELYLMLYDTESKKSSDNMLPFILEQSAKEGFVEFKDRDEATPFERYVKGAKMINVSKEDKKVEDVSTIFLDDYKSYNYREQLQIKPSTERFYISHEEGYLSPRHYGVIMHKLFERIESVEDIAPVLEEMMLGGIISSADRDSTLMAINKSLENPTIREWFEPFWEVKAENDIILPSPTGKFVSCRPDRVLISGDRAVVIDYKFGMKKSSHLKQIGSYVSVLRQMGYRDVEGYVWYVLSNELDECL